MTIQSPVLSFIVMSLSIAAVTSTNNIITSFASSATPRSSPNLTHDYLSPRLTPRKAMHMGATGDVPFCAEAVTNEFEDGDGSTAKNENNVHISRLEHDTDKNLGYDISSARGWMEHIEQCDGPVCGVGAYTVLRCDAIYSKDKCNWKIWGLDFHMGRLCSSYRMLMESVDPGFDGDTVALHEEESKQRTDDVIAALLEEAKMSLLEEELAKETNGNDLEGEELARTLMVTVLWKPSRIHPDSKECKNEKPTIRGHAAFAGVARAKNSKEYTLSSPISACLAVANEPTPEALALLPRRHSDNDGSDQAQLVGASAKISSWCRIRRPLEDPTRFKAPRNGVGEVLLVRENKDKCDDERSFIDSLEILEGLTSNLFVIYKDGTVRTAQAGTVLSGYARHLVLEGLSEFKGLTLDDSNAPTVQDAKDGLWSEVFVTSAIRLIIPVNRILIPSVGGIESNTLWQSNDGDERCAHPLTRSIWSAIHNREFKSAAWINVKNGESY